MISSSHAHDNKMKVLVGSRFGACKKGRKGVWKIKSSYPSPLRGAPLPQGSSTIRMARRLRGTDEICKQLNTACELTGRGFKQANAASKQAGWSCPPKVGGRAKRRGYERNL